MEPPPSNELPGESYSRGRITASEIVAAASLLGGAVWAFLRYRPSRVAVQGPSMAPALLPGDWVLVVRPRRYRRDDVVVVEHPGRPGYEMIKRLKAVPGDTVGGRRLGPDEYWIEGDMDRASTDSRHFGPVSREELKAKAFAVYWPPVRRGLVR